ncbi:hypothetical protein [Pseudomonas sp. GM78]|uniref:hypothetical protein n=1 Tax=Pseudomonas sp. GM78 TaxID=1144337 RepID=UPI000519D0A2
MLLRYLAQCILSLILTGSPSAKSITAAPKVTTAEVPIVLPFTFTYPQKARIKGMMGLKNGRLAQDGERLFKMNKNQFDFVGAILAFTS